MMRSTNPNHFSKHAVFRKGNVCSHIYKDGPRWVFPWLAKQARMQPSHLLASYIYFALRKVNMSSPMACIHMQTNHKQVTGDRREFTSPHVATAPCTRRATAKYVHFGRLVSRDCDVIEDKGNALECRTIYVL